LGYVEHRDYEAEYRYADGDLGQLPRLATELASLNPDVIVVASTAAALAAKRAAPSIPIVVAAATNPVRFGLPGLSIELAEATKSWLLFDTECSGFFSGAYLR
jgi:ABC-type uncharacterized transport system substrate-binding protein